MEVLTTVNCQAQQRSEGVGRVNHGGKETPGRATLTQVPAAAVVVAVGVVAATKGALPNAFVRTIQD